MSLQFIIGGSGSGKTRTLYENLIRQSMEEPDGRFFALVPEQFTMRRERDRDAASEPWRENIDIVSFERLAYRVFEELAIENLAVLDDMGKIDGSAARLIGRPGKSAPVWRASGQGGLYQRDQIDAV